MIASPKTENQPPHLLPRGQAIPPPGAHSPDVQTVKVQGRQLSPETKLPVTHEIHEDCRKGLPKGETRDGRQGQPGRSTASLSAIRPRSSAQSFDHETTRGAMGRRP